MIHRMFDDDDGNCVQEFDAEAIDYLIDGLRELRDMEPGEELSTPSFKADENDIPDSASEFILRRVEDADA